MKPPVIRRVTIRNYKSIAACQIELARLMFLVGPNGSGKSNFFDALRFVADALRSSLDHALRDRGTIKEVRRRSGEHPNHFALRFDFSFPRDKTATMRSGLGPGRAAPMRCRRRNAASTAGKPRGCTISASIREKCPARPCRPCPPRFLEENSRRCGYRDFRSPRSHENHQTSRTTQPAGLYFRQIDFVWGKRDNRRSEAGTQRTRGADFTQARRVRPRVPSGRRD